MGSQQGGIEFPRVGDRGKVSRIAHDMEVAKKAVVIDYSYDNQKRDARKPREWNPLAKAAGHLLSRLRRTQIV